MPIRKFIFNRNFVMSLFLSIYLKNHWFIFELWKSGHKDIFCESKILFTEFFFFGLVFLWICNKKNLPSKFLNNLITKLDLLFSFKDFALSSQSFLLKIYIKEKWSEILNKNYILAAMSEIILKWKRIIVE